MACAPKAFARCASLKEGLAGLVAEEMRPIEVRDAVRHSRYKHFPEAGEDHYRSFLGLPLVDRGLLQGVLVVQTEEPREFGNDEIQRLVETAAPLSPIVSEVRTIEQLIAPDFEQLCSLARNLWWCWNMTGDALFRALDPVRWRELDHNPVTLISEIPLLEMEERIERHVLRSGISHTCSRLQEYLESQDTWGDTHAGVLGARPVAYFSDEFGLHESLPIYSGGLGILAGDHIKIASDLGVPLIGIGLYYNQGYFHQHLDQDGWQHEDYLDVDVWRLPMEAATGQDGQPVTIRIETRRGELLARVWKLKVGRCTLLLLDSDVVGNSDDDRTRIRQELLLGVGGVRALHALGIDPGVVHMNEGHSAFAALEIARMRMQVEGVEFPEARLRVSRRNVSTTHTPVPAGHDRLHTDLVEEHLGPLRDGLGLDHEEFMGLGRVDPGDPRETFCMTVLALGMSRRTNGVHVPSWLAPQMRTMYDRHFGTDWVNNSARPEVWARTMT